jgi:hypothetical protein
MLDVRAASPEPHLRPYCPSLCVAPSAVFTDYDRVMARLKAEQDGLDDVELIDAEVRCHPLEAPETHRYAASKSSGIRD